MKAFSIPIALYLYFVAECFAIHPVVFVPGDGGSQLDAKLNKTSSVHYICEKTSADYFNIWLNMELLVPMVIDCWIDNVKLTYDNVTRKTYNTPGVDIRVPGKYIGVILDNLFNFFYKVLAALRLWNGWILVMLLQALISMQ